MKTAHVIWLLVILGLAALAWLFRANIAAFVSGTDVSTRGNLPPPVVTPPNPQPKKGLSGKDAIILGGTAACAGYLGPQVAPLCGAAAPGLYDLGKKVFDWLT
jgi:hypothetical protein